MSKVVNDFKEKNEREFAEAAERLTREYPEAKMTLTEDMIERLLELEKISDFRIPESIAQKIKKRNIS